MTKEERREYLKQWYEKHPGLHAAYQRKWVANNPDKHAAAQKKWNRKKAGTKFLNRRKAKFASFHRGMSYRAEISRLLLKGKDPVDIAMWTRMPVSVVMEVKNSIGQESKTQ